MKRYCIKRLDLRRRYEYKNVPDGVKILKNGILDGILDEEYFQENFIKIKRKKGSNEGIENQ